MTTDDPNQQMPPMRHSNINVPSYQVEELKRLIKRLRDTYHAWNNPPSDALPNGAGVVLEAADALESVLKKEGKL